jgi:hypothetical protein
MASSAAFIAHPGAVRVVLLGKRSALFRRITD